VTLMTSLAHPALTNCLICDEPVRPFARIGGAALRDWFYGTELRQIIQELEYGRCPGCQSVWAQDGRRDTRLLNQIYAALPPQYWAEMSDDPAFYAVVDQLLTTHAPGPRLCDVGCGDGKLLRGLPSRWEKHGLEPGLVATERCAASGIAVRAGTPASVQYDEPFDALTCVDVVEHLADPDAELRGMAGMLRPGGVLLILTGDPTARTARWAGDNWEYLHWVGHVSVLSPKGLRVLLERSGFDVVVQQAVDHTTSWSVGRWTRKWLGNCLRHAVGLQRQRLYYCRDHQLVLARRRVTP